MKKIKLTGLVFLALLLSHCLLDSKSGGDDSVKRNEEWGNVLVLGSDFKTGKLQTKMKADTAYTKASLTIHKDAKAIENKGNLYVLERFGADNILKLDLSKSKDSAVSYQTHLGDNWNPSDIAFSGEKAFITLENEPKLLVFDPVAGKVTKSIDISSYIYKPDTGSTASSPHAKALSMVGENLYVLLQRRHGNYTASPDTAKVLRVNVKNDAIEKAINLRYRNPQAMIEDNGSLYVSAIGAGSWGALGDGGIEKLVLSTTQSTSVITDTDLGGDPMKMVQKSGSIYYVIVYVGWGNVQVKEVDFSTGKVLKTIEGITDAFGGIAYDKVDEVLYVCERATEKSGLKTFDKDGKLIAGPLKGTLPPNGVVLLK